MTFQKFILLTTAALAFTVTSNAHAKSLTGDEIRSIYPGDWMFVPKRGAKGTITYKPDGSGALKIGKYKSPII